VHVVRQWLWIPAAMIMDILWSSVPDAGNNGFCDAWNVHPNGILRKFIQNNSEELCKFILLRSFLILRAFLVWIINPFPSSTIHVYSDSSMTGIYLPSLQYFAVAGNVSEKFPFSIFIPWFSLYGKKVKKRGLRIHHLILSIVPFSIRKQSLKHFESTSLGS
jgi:hypothetical protein